MMILGIIIGCIVGIIAGNLLRPWARIDLEKDGQPVGPNGEGRTWSKTFPGRPPLNYRDEDRRVPPVEKDRA